MGDFKEDFCKSDSFFGGADLKCLTNAAVVRNILNLC